MQDRDIDNLANPHEVKHWMDPKLIPYGWGLFEGLSLDEDIGIKQELISVKNASLSPLKTL